MTILYLPVAIFWLFVQADSTIESIVAEADGGAAAISAEQAVAAGASMFDLPKLVTFPASYGAAYTGEGGRPDWNSNPPAWRADVDRLVRQNVYEAPDPALTRVMHLSSLETQAERRLLLASIRPAHLKRKLASVPTLLTDDLSVVESPVASPASTGSGLSSSSSSSSSALSSSGNVLSANDILDILNLVSEGVATGNAIATGATTTVRPVNNIAEGISNIFQGAYRLNSAFTELLGEDGSSGLLQKLGLVR